MLHQKRNFKCALTNGILTGVSVSNVYLEETLRDILCLIHYTFVFINKASVSILFEHAFYI